jgi:hypothetical protein
MAYETHFNGSSAYMVHRPPYDCCAELAVVEQAIIREVRDRLLVDRVITQGKPWPPGPTIAVNGSSTRSPSGKSVYRPVWPFVKDQHNPTFRESWLIVPEPLIDIRQVIIQMNGIQECFSETYEVAFRDSDGEWSSSIHTAAGGSFVMKPTKTKTKTKTETRKRHHKDE